MGAPQVTVAAGAAHAMVFLESLDRFPRAAPNLILLAMNPPDAGGLAVLRYAKGHKKLSAIPVLVVMAAQDPGAIAEAYELRANCCIVKPAMLDQWDRAIELMCRFWLEFARLPDRF